jgi:hypothetical protein
MRGSAAPWLAAGALGATIACVHGRLNIDQKWVTAAQRLDAIQRAQVWKPTDVRSMNLREGPQRKGAFAPGETVTCNYVNERLGGNTPKFACVAAGDDQLKVRYGRDNGEVYAGVAATRLLWALGFGADAVYPVHVICRGCPPGLDHEARPAEGGIRFDVAAIERKFPGKDIESPSTGPGWAWPELDLVDEKSGGAPLAQRDGLKLLAVLLQHTDSKPDQQRLVCTDAKAERSVSECASPFMLIHDVGQTFGEANLFNRQAIGSVNLAKWTEAHIWKNPKTCTGNLLQSQTGTLVNPQISESGRRFLAGLLDQLSDSQLRDLFDVARFAERPGGGGTVDQWVDEFKRKREEIDSVTCE